MADMNIGFIVIHNISRLSGIMQEHSPSALAMMVVESLKLMLEKLWEWWNVSAP